MHLAPVTPQAEDCGCDGQEVGEAESAASLVRSRADHGELGGAGFDGQEVREAESAASLFRTRSDHGELGGAGELSILGRTAEDAMAGVGLGTSDKDDASFLRRRLFGGDFASAETGGAT